MHSVRAAGSAARTSPVHRDRGAVILLHWLADELRRGLAAVGPDGLVDPRRHVGRVEADVAVALAAGAWELARRDA